MWITGASSGIGEYLAYEFAKADAKLVLSARNEEKLSKVKAKTGLEDANCFIQPLDLSRSDEFEGLVENVIGHFGQIDVLINNGGISQRGFVRDTSVEVDRKIMETDFFGHVILTKLVLGQMRERKWGQIAVTTSIVGEFGFPLRSAYSAAKHALHGFFETLKLEEKDSGVQVNLIIPGRIRTEVSVNAIDGDGEKQGTMDPGLENGMLVEVAARKIFLKLKKNKYKILVGNKELIMVYLKRWLPGLFRYLAARVSPS